MACIRASQLFQPRAAIVADLGCLSKQRDDARSKDSSVEDGRKTLTAG